jgi:FxsC-like protein
MPGKIQAEDKRPHFFLSYARSRYRPQGSDPDRWVAKFFNDLCEDVALATGMQVPGFMDRQIPVGTAWPDYLTDALANCRVFVALFSPTYFTSEYCGREWAAFIERVERQTAGRDLPSAIIPAWWTPMNLSGLPPSLQPMQNASPRFPTAYTAEGLYGIMKLGRYRQQYKETVFRLANIIKDRAAECALAASPVSDLDSLRNPFAQPQGTQRHQIRLTLATQSLDKLPPDRDRYYYGRTVDEWTPYRSQDHPISIGTYAGQVIADFGHHYVVDQVDDPGREPLDSPGILVVDPWATRDPSIADRLREIDDHHPVNVLAPFNSEDLQTVAASDGLSESLGEVLPNSSALTGSATRISTIQAFRDALPKAVNEAITRFFKTTNAYPPRTPPTMQRPKLQGPEF